MPCAGLTLLRELSLAGCRNISEEGRAGALAGLKPLTQLEALHLRNCDGLQDGALDCFSALHRLANLDLSGCQQLSGRGWALALCLDDVIQGLLLP